MPILEDAKRALETMTGYGRPARRDLAALTRERKPHLFRFKDDGATPNNPHFPMVIYRSAVRSDRDFDPAAVFEELFSAHGWRDSWRNGMYDFLHFHTGAHEALGIARGTLRAKFGGAPGRMVDLEAGDVVILPAGTGHRRLKASRDLLIVGAYMAWSRYDEPKPDDVDHEEALASIARVRAPRSDPVYGRDGPLPRLWRPPH